METIWKGRQCYFFTYGRLRGADRWLVGDGMGNYLSKHGNWVGGIAATQRWASLDAAMLWVVTHNGSRPKRTYAEVCAAKIEGWD